MRSRLALVLCLALCLGAAACRQSDGQLPPIAGDTPNRIQDLEHDLINVVNGDKEGPQDLADDLAVFVRRDRTNTAQEFGRRVAAAVTGSKLTPETAKPLANHLWVTVSATELSDRQITQLKTDIKGTLMSMGVSEANAQGVGDQAESVQKAVRTRTKRWYEWF